MRILVVGGGGREHALVWKLNRSSQQPDLFCAPGNAGTDALATNVDIFAADIDGLLEFARRERIDLTIVGPEEPLCAGIVDRFEAAGLRIFGPRAAAARLEGDKAWAKHLMKAANIPTADARVFTPGEVELTARRTAEIQIDPDVPTLVTTAHQLARDYIATREAPLVVKAAGLAKGKGVFVCNDPSEALRAIETLMVDRAFGDAGDTVVIEERLTGVEASVQALVDGRSIYVLETVRDHKRLHDADGGPNTGGMGAYSPADDMNDDLMHQIEGDILVPIVDALRREGIVYRGVLYAGLMLTPGGPKVLEFNCRFGDPETQPLMMRLKTDLVEVIEAVLDERLEEVELEWDSRPAVCVVLAAPGYPDTPMTGADVRGLKEVAAVGGAQVFHAGTRRDGPRVRTSGGRVLSVTALGDDLPAARKRAYQAVERITFDGMQYRRDIAAAHAASTAAFGGNRP